MQNFTNCTIEGFVTHDITTKTTKTDKTVCTFSLAIAHYSRPEEPAKVSFIEVEAWNELAEQCIKQVDKAKKVMVSGNLRQDRWEDEKGKVASRLKVVASEIRIYNTAEGRYVR